MTDPIAEMFVQIQNAQNAGKDTVSVHFSKVKMAILDILQRSHKINSFRQIDDKNRPAAKKIEIKLSEQSSQRMQIKRISCPGRRVYASNGRIPRPKSPKGLLIFSTSEGMMTGEEARKKGLGGEFIGEVV